MFRFKTITRIGTCALAMAACSSAGKGDDDDDVLEACEPTSAGGFTYEKIGTWADDAKGAYSLIHDDMCGAQLHGIQDNAVPALDEAGIKAGLAPIAGECEDNAAWDIVVDAEKRGHEIVSHSFTHVNITPENAAHEIADAKTMFDSHTANPITFFVFPYDHFTHATIAKVSMAGHIGARAGNRDDNDGFSMPPINGADPTNDMEAEFDVWPRSYSKYALFFPEDMLAVHAYNAIDRGGWALREFHSVMPDGADASQHGFGPIDVTSYKKHLAFLRDAWDKGVLWTAPPSTIVRYRHARTACTASVSGDMITFDTSNTECTKYATPISVIVTTATDVPRVDGTQGGATVASRKLDAKRFSITADPTKGPVALTACGNRGHEIDPSIQIPARPMPAKSVCEIETVAGTGSPGKMDNLERDTGQLQVLPNPGQADGRTGSWSWYPQAAQVSIDPDGANKALHYRGTGLNAWTGATLAFLGGNGAGTCYDASRYQGIRFRIKGSVAATDELNGKVIVSLVTSETQSRDFGGDLMGTGGHFNKVIAITAGWTTVSITFAELGRPTWGATTMLTAVAKGKLQAIDWGVTDKASSFDIWLDDIELY
ncbi:MAG TPA: polysaccharide deacetylase family protein [Kofleriaceae bacterium]